MKSKGSSSSSSGGKGNTATGAGGASTGAVGGARARAAALSSSSSSAATATTAARSHHRSNLPAVEEFAMDPKIIEERKRNALAHAMGGAAAAGGGGGDDATTTNSTTTTNAKQQPKSSTKNQKVLAGSAASMGGKTSTKPSSSSSASVLVGASSAASSSSSSSLLPKNNAASRRPQPNYPPASELIFGTTATTTMGIGGGKRSSSLSTAAAAALLSKATTSSTSAAVAQGGATKNDPPPKRKAGRPRKGVATGDTTTTTASIAAAATTTASTTTNVARKLSLSSTTTTSATATTTSAVEKRNVGRPRKYPPRSDNNDSNNTNSDDADSNDNTDYGDAANQGTSHQQHHANNEGLLPSTTHLLQHPPPPPTTTKPQSSSTTSSSSSSPVSSSPYYDDEYARFMRSIIGDTNEDGDDRSILTFKTLQSIRTNNVNHDDDNNTAAFGGREVGSTLLENTTLDEDDFSYQLTSEDEDDDDDDDDEEEEEDDEDKEEKNEEEQEEEKDPAVGMQSPPRGTTIQSSTSMSPPPPLPASSLTIDQDDDDDLFNVLGEIEDLMEEDLEFAFMASLIGGSNFDLMGSSSSGAGDELLGGPSSRGGTGIGNSGTTGRRGETASSKTNNVGSTIVGTLQKQMAVTTPGVSTKKKKSTTTVVTTPPQFTNRARMQQQAEVAAAGASTTTTTNINNTSNVSSASLGIVGGAGGAGMDVPPVTRKQLARLRSMMAHHHQLLVQQATLSVRAAYVQKVRKDGLSSNTSSAATTTNTTAVGEIRRNNMLLPASRLETKSLTFISKPVASECSYENDFFGGETPDELSECLDGSVGMLQDLEQNWKDAVRKSFQFPPPPHAGPVVTVSSSQPHGAVSGARKLKLGELPPKSSRNSANNNNTDNINSFDGGNTNASEADHGCSSAATSSRRLTRSALNKTLLERDSESSAVQQDKESPSPAKNYPPSSSSISTTATNAAAHYAPSRVSVFDIRGLSRLKATFSALDNSVKDIVMGREKGKNKDGINILAPDAHGKACEILLKHARAEIDMEYLPGGQDMGLCLTHAPEAFDEPDKVHHPLTKLQEAELRRNRHTFTAGEDNLILRGVNLYGEKEWCLVSDRFLPDRVVNSISQRYNKLCFLIYKANGIELDDKGKLPPIPKYKKGETYDVVKAEKLKPAHAPTTMNVHRWTLEEDIAILKATPIMGNFWAEIGTRLLPHRDRGHIRKRFQVLQRRIPKGIAKMSMKYLKRPAEQPVKSTRSPKRTKVGAPQVGLLRSPPTKKRATKKPSVHKHPAAVPPSPAHIVHPGMKVPDAAAAAASSSAITSSSPARIFQLADQARKRRPPMSPMDRVPHAEAVQPFSTRGSPRALFQAVETIQSSDIIGRSSPETKNVASVLGGFSQSSHYVDENSQMHVEKILGDEWSQASRMGRLLLAGNAESNFVSGHLTNGTAELSQVEDMLPAYPYGDEASQLSVINGEHPTVAETQKGEQNSHGKRKSILSSVMEKTNKNASKRKNTDAAFPSTPTKVPCIRHEGNVGAIANEYHSNALHPTAVTSLHLGTPAKEERSVFDTTQGEATMSQEFFEYFMSDKSRADEEGSMMPDGAVDNVEMIFSPAKTNMMISPIKIGKMTNATTTLTAASTPLSQCGTIASISGPLDGENSLFMQSSVFDAASALKDLSTSTPNTPSKLLRPMEDFQDDKRDAEDAQYQHNDVGESYLEEKEGRMRNSVPKTSFFGKVKARLTSDIAEERKNG